LGEAAAGLFSLRTSQTNAQSSLCVRKSVSPGT
jgi:hypothetical protein